MAARRLDTGDNRKRRNAPAKTPEGRQKQLESYAYDLAEQQLLDGTASAAMIVHFLKASSMREKAELERLRNDNLLTEARIKQIDSQRDTENLMKNALRAFTEYRGQEVEDDGEPA